MDTRHYRVRYSGQLVEGISPAQLSANLKELGFTDNQIDSLLSGRTATIKKGLPRTQAEIYRARLKVAGLLVELEVEDEAPAADVAPAGGSVRFEAREPSREQSAEPGLPRRLEPVKFTGIGSEFFGIWIVNILLIVLTLGFYAPWAKVRTNQYFYGHTEVAGASFQYLADPWVIFRGRLVALAALILWMVVSNFWAMGALILLLLFIPLVPWIVIRALKFNAVNSAWRNVRFDFQGGYGQAFMAIYVWPILAVLSLLLALPYSLFKLHGFVVNNMRFGTMPFRFKASGTDYYVFFFRVIGVLVGFVLLSLLVSSLHGALAIITAAIGYLALFGYFLAGLTNLIMNSTVLGLHGFESTLGKRRMVWIYLTNSLFIVLTLGLFTPWAKVRMATYRASCTQVQVYGDLDSFVAAETQRTSAIGQELGEAFDVGIPVI
ncbi:hypothetical protein CK507_02265 [Pseudomonas sp. WN033]|nr:hypothetical protein CK507_02265 [Pseudomonas sp. WN033]